MLTKQKKDTRTGIKIKILRNEMYVKTQNNMVQPKILEGIKKKGRSARNQKDCGEQRMETFHSLTITKWRQYKQKKNEQQVHNQK